MLILFAYLYLTVLGVILTFMFAEFRIPIKKAYLVIGCFVVALLFFDIFLYFYFGQDLFSKIYPFANHVPAILTMAYISKYRDCKLIFQCLSGVLFCIFVNQVSVLIYLILGKHIWLIFVIYGLLTFLIAWFFFKYLRPLYLQIVHSLNKGFPLICLTMAIYYVIEFFVITDQVGESFLGTVIKPMFTLLMVGVYAVIIVLFISIKREMETMYYADLFALQVCALQNHIEAINTAEETIRIEHHDFRHRLNTIAALVEEDNKDAALSYIGTVKESLETAQPKKWCNDSMLNAMFSFYFQQAQKNGIEVEAKLDFPKKIPVETIELSIVFANALENAINACQKLPKDKRKIICRAIKYPQLMIEIANPYILPVCFDMDGFPKSTEAGHGFGTQSIKNFCKKYNASCYYKCEKEWFNLKISF